MKNQIIGEDFLNYLESLSLYIKGPENGLFGGMHQTKTYGSSVEFADFKEYNLGDDIKKIDWNLYARFEKYFLKLYVDEKQLHIQLFLDVSASMKFYESKKECAIKVLVTLGYLAINNMDKLTIHLLYKDRDIILGNKTISHKDEFLELADNFNNIEFKDETNINTAITNIDNIGFGDGMSIIISDFLMDDSYKRAVDYLLYKHKEVMLVHIVSLEEISPSYGGRLVLLDAEDNDRSSNKNLRMKISKAEIEAYNMALKEYMDEIYNFATSRNVTYIKLDADKQFEKVFLEKLEQGGIIK